MTINASIASASSCSQTRRCLAARYCEGEGMSTMGLGARGLGLGAGVVCQVPSPETRASSPAIIDDLPQPGLEFCHSSLLRRVEDDGVDRRWRIMRQFLRKRIVHGGQGD